MADVAPSARRRRARRRARRPRTRARPPAIRLERAAVAYGERRIWEGLDLSVPAGEFLAVLGPNGAGKTTLLKVVLGLERPSGGTVEVEGRAPRRGSKRIGYIPQQRAFDPTCPCAAATWCGSAWTAIARGCCSPGARAGDGSTR